MRDSLDRFYTPQSSAEYCINTIENIKDYDLIIEPSAGSGSFSNLIPECLAYDIASQNDTIITQDYLELKELPEHNKMLIIGNPPFDTRSTLAKKFIKHSINLGASTIAFILPQTFKKYTNQTMFNSDWRLVTVSNIPDDNFLLEETTIHIPCSFFVWTKLQDYKPLTNLRDIKQPPAQEFTFLPREDNRADFTINGNNGKTKNISDITNSKAEHYIKVNPEYNVDTIRKQLDTIDFEIVSSVNGGVAWLGQNDILRHWHNRN